VGWLRSRGRPDRQCRARKTCFMTHVAVNESRVTNDEEQARWPAGEGQTTWAIREAAPKREMPLT
jgi:hypothetical protein